MISLTLQTAGNNFAMPCWRSSAHMVRSQNIPNLWMLTLRKAPKSRFRPYSKRPFLRLVDLDELHCVMTWGDSFRPAYRSLHVLRNRIQRNIPWFGASATLWPDILNCKVCFEQGLKRYPHYIWEPKSRQHLPAAIGLFSRTLSGGQSMRETNRRPRVLRSSENAVLGKMSRGSPLPLPTEHRDTRRIIQSIPKAIIFFAPRISFWMHGSSWQKRYHPDTPFPRRPPKG